MSGALEAIFITANKGQPLVSVPVVQAREGVGLEGDRYAARTGTFSKSAKVGRDVTLIEAEAIEAAGRDYETPLAASEARRNLLTRGVALNHLVGKRFTIGEVLFEGVELCEPCKHLETLSRPGVLKALVHRGGLRARIVRDGTLRVGDPFQLAD
jgi:MOSC domain-containing protein YiiM